MKAVFDTPHPRVLIYSHDTFGLGHLRRCRAIAHSLVRHVDDLSVLILSGSPIIGSFDFRSRVDFVRVPGVIKLRDGDYTSLNLSLDVNDTLAIRSSIIEHTAQVFAPDIFIVDKEPLGLRGEVENTLKMLRAQGCHNVLGLRDVLDSAEELADEWDRKNAFHAVETLYDDIWVYGLESIYDPLRDLPLSQSVRDKTRFTGYLRRSIPEQSYYEPEVYKDEPFILVTPGGGGDGVELVDWVMRAYEAQQRPLFPALIVLGPFMPTEKQAEFRARAAKLRNVRIIRFSAHIESIMDKATAVVGMGGYNTFCEILSFDKPAVLVPRVVPRREQSIRAQRAEEVGLIRTLPIERYPNVDAMADALAGLPEQQGPSYSGLEGLMDGLAVINGMATGIIESARKAPEALAVV